MVISLLLQLTCSLRRLSKLCLLNWPRDKTKERTQEQRNEKQERKREREREMFVGKQTKKPRLLAMFLVTWHVTTHMYGPNFIL